MREINELVILNDEAYNIHDSKLAWFKSIQDIRNRFKQKDMIPKPRRKITESK
ncbi:hypothetical protein KA977_11780 [Candidatus Dependentiae bacterium]|nr:hypothetical protein [Candidatus Dependentiae bacterium]